MKLPILPSAVMLLIVPLFAHEGHDHTEGVGAIITTATVTGSEGLEYDTAVFHGCTKNSNAQKAETLIGSIVALHPKWGVIHVGSGFGHALSADMYANPGRYRCQVFTFKYKKHGTDEKPRQPIFVDFEGK